jgi:hypothetical protein
MYLYWQVVQEINEHNHDVDERKNESQILQTRAKKKTEDDMSQRPSKIIRTELQKMQEENLSSSDLKSSAKAVYRKRRRTHPPLPKSRIETHTSY